MGTKVNLVGVDGFFLLGLQTWHASLAAPLVAEVDSKDHQGGEDQDPHGHQDCGETVDPKQIGLLD